MPADASSILNINKSLNSQNANWRSYWQELAQFALPRKAWINTPKFIGERIQFNFLYDSTAIRSLKIMSSGFHSQLTNAATRWWGIEFRKKDLNKNRAIQMWCKEVVEITTSIMYASNYDSALQEFFPDYGCFGTATILTQADPKKKVRYEVIPIEQQNLEEDAYGNVNGMYRNFRLTPMQAYMLWGKKSGKTVCDIMDDFEKDGSTSKAFEDMDFLHYVGPRHRYDASMKDNLNKPFVSVWIAVKDAHKIEESGFDEFPYGVARFWKDSRDVFGFSPTMDVLCNIKTRNAQKRTALRRGMKEADPPMDVPSKGYVLPLNQNPSAMNYRDAKAFPEKSGIFPLGAFSTGNFSITREVMDMEKEDIEAGYYVPLFQALTMVSKQMTVPEVERRIAESMGLLGPVIGRCEGEALGPSVLRTINILYRNGELPPIPEIAKDEEFDIVYMGPLAKAQKMSEMNTLQGFLNFANGVAGVIPSAIDNLDEDEIIKLGGRITGVDPVVFREQAKIDAMRENRMKLQQAAQQMDLMHKGAAVAQTGAKAEHEHAKAENVRKAA